MINGLTELALSLTDPAGFFALANSSLAGWALMIAGFGLAGAILRRRTPVEA